jgi:hypothetical protein
LCGAEDALASHGDQRLDLFATRVQRGEVVEPRRAFRPPLPGGVSSAREFGGQRGLGPLGSPRFVVERGIISLVGLHERGFDQVDQRDFLKRELTSRRLEAALPEQSPHVALLVSGTVWPVDLREAERTWVDGASGHNGDTLLGQRPLYLCCRAKAPTGIEPVASSGHALEPNLWAWVKRQAADAVRLYRPRFDVGDAL